MKNLIKLILLLFAVTPLVAEAQKGDCPGWGSGQDSIENIQNHVLYRDYLIKMKDFDGAFPLWQKVYESAPGASVKHFNDGIKIYKHFYDSDTNETKKAEYQEMIMKLYDEKIACFGREGATLGRKSFDMFYVIGAPYENVFEDGKRSIDLEGDKTKSFVIYPFAHVVVEMYKDSLLSMEEVLEIYEKLNNIADHNIENTPKEKDKEKYTKAIDATNKKFDEIARDGSTWKGIFGCDYFVAIESPNYLSVYDSLEGIKGMVQRLNKAKCDETTPLVVKLVNRYNVLQDSLDKANRLPSRWVVVSLRDGLIEEAKEWYEKALVDEREVIEDLYTASMALGKVVYRDQKNKSAARSYFLKALKFQPNSADPYYMIGELYASSGPDCGPGTGWDSQVVVWVAIDKWKMAISADPGSEAARKAQNKINEYTKYMPTTEQIFQRGLKVGQGFTVKCWIQENTTIRAYNPFK